MKTHAELEALPDDELRVMLAELCGFKWWISGKDFHYLMIKPANLLFCESERPPFDGRHINIADTPNYPQDLNACHGVENSLGDEYPTHNREYFRKQLRRVCNHPSHTHEVHATARHRTIALILTLQSPS